MPDCAHCQQPAQQGECTAFFRCSQCEGVAYCSERCQLDHWPMHRQTCAADAAATATAAVLPAPRGEAPRAGLSKTRWAKYNQRAKFPRPLGLQDPNEPRLQVAERAPAAPAPAALAHALPNLNMRYPLSQAQIAAFRRDRYIRLKDVVPAEVLAAARQEAIDIVLPAMGGTNLSEPAPDSAAAKLLSNLAPAAGTGKRQEAGDESVLSGTEAFQFWEQVSMPATKPWHVQMGWTQRPTLRALVLAPRIGTRSAPPLQSFPSISKFFTLPVAQGISSLGSSG